MFVLCSLHNAILFSSSSDEAPQEKNAGEFAIPDADDTIEIPTAPADYFLPGYLERARNSLHKSRHAKEHKERRELKKRAREKRELKKVIRFYKTILKFMHTNTREISVSGEALNKTMCDVYVLMGKTNKKFFSKYNTRFLRARIKGLLKSIHVVATVEAELDDETNLQLIRKAACTPEDVQTYLQKLTKQLNKLEEQLKDY